MDLSRFPRVPLGHFPTPLEPLSGLTAFLGGPKLYVKRDDCTGLGLGGNKTRKLEFLVADALEGGADCLVTVGGVQSNHVRQTAAAAAKAGLACHAMLEAPVMPDSDYAASGNALLDHMFGAKLHHHDPAEGGFEDASAALVESLKADGARPYFMPAGGSTAIGSLGYVSAGMELMAQADAQRLLVTHIVHATGSQGTQAGLLVGAAAADEEEAGIFGVTVSRERDEQEEKVSTLAEETADLVGMPGAVPRESVICDDGHFLPGYGLPNPGMIEAVTLAARHDGLLLDPVYTGKAMAGLIAMARDGRLTKEDTVVFVHTGGAPGLFAYPDEFTRRAAGQ